MAMREIKLFGVLSLERGRHHIVRSQFHPGHWRPGSREKGKSIMGWKEDHPLLVRRFLRSATLPLLLATALAGCGATSQGQLATAGMTTVTVTVPASTAVSPPAAATPNGAQELVTALQIAASVASAAQGPTPTAVPLISRPLEGTLPRQVQYADMQFKVTKATITNQDPSGTTVADRAFAYVDLTVVNPGSGGQSLAENLLKLTLAGRMYPEQSGATLALTGDTSGDMHLRYQVPPDATWDNAGIVIGRPQKEPATLPLTGPAPAAQFPTKLATKGTAMSGQIDYRVQAANLDLDYAGTRADMGKRFLTFAVVMVNDRKNPTGGFTSARALSQSEFRLVVDGLPAAPLNTFGTLLDVNASYQTNVVFVVPAGTAKAQLQVGEGGDYGQATIPLDLTPSSA
jgi:hypothetical protein